MNWKEFFKPSIISIISCILFIVLFAFVPFIPCKTFPVIPNPTYEWSLCSLNPFILNNVTGVGHYYFGVNFDFTPIMYLLTIVISYLLACLVKFIYMKYQQ